MNKTSFENLINLAIKKYEENSINVDNVSYSYDVDCNGNIVNYGSFIFHTSMKYYNSTFKRISNSMKTIDDIENNIIELKNYFNEQTIQYDFNKVLDLSKNKLEDLKELVKGISETNAQLKTNYCLYIPYDLLGVLELKKVNKKSITCLDSLNNKVYLTGDVLDKLYIEGETIRVYNI
jgi:hypothetical protein